MDFTPDESASDVRGLARDIAATLSTPERIAELENNDSAIDEALWQELGTAGLLGLEIPSGLVGDDGGDLSAIENAVVAEELGRTLARVPFVAHAVAALPVVAARGPAALPPQGLSSATRGATVLTVAFEEDLVTDSDRLTTSLTSGSEGTTLTGTKVEVPYAQAAQAYVVSAVGADGPVAVVVRADDPGVRITPTPCTGKIPTAQVDFTDVPVDTNRILTGGTAAVVEITDRMTLGICAEQSGIVSRALELTAEYAREREQFGRPIGSFQAVAQRLADGYIDTQALSLTTTQAAWLMSRADADDTATNTELRTAIATAKFWAAEAGHRVAHTTVHVHGGVGLDTSHPVHRFFLRAKQNEFSYGSAAVVLDNIGTELATSPA